MDLVGTKDTKKRKACQEFINPSSLSRSPDNIFPNF